VDRPAGKGTVEIDDVQPRETLGREGARLRGRIVVEDSGLRHLAAFQAHAASVLQIDGGVEDHGARGHHFAMFVGAQWGRSLSSQGRVVPAPRVSGPGAPRRLSEADAIDIW